MELDTTRATGMKRINFNPFVSVRQSKSDQWKYDYSLCVDGNVALLHQRERASRVSLFFHAMIRHVYENYCGEIAAHHIFDVEVGETETIRIISAQIAYTITTDNIIAPLRWLTF